MAIPLDEQAANLAREARDIEQTVPRSDEVGHAVSELARIVQALAQIVSVLAINEDDK